MAKRWHMGLGMIGRAIGNPHQQPKGESDEPPHPGDGFTQEEAKPRMDLPSPKPAMSAPPRTDGGAFVFTPACLVLATAEAPVQGPLQRLHSPVARMLAEFRRALAAERRHQELKQGPTAKGDISRRVYEEFYSGTSAGLNGAG